MATEYLMKRESPMMNWMRYDTSPYLPPEAEMILEMRGTRQGVEAVNESMRERFAESLLHLRDMDDDLRRGNRSLEHLDEMSGRMAGSLDSISSGLGELDGHFREGLSDMRDQLAEMGWDMRDGLAGVNETLQDGFGAVVFGLAKVDERIAAHVSALQAQLRTQHDDLLTALDSGFGQMSEAVLLSADYLAKVMTANSDAQLRQMAREGDATRRMIAETSQRQINKIEEVRRAIITQDEHRAEQHFMVGLNYFNHGFLPRAYRNFQKAEHCFDGHFPTLFMLGFMRYLKNDMAAAHESFEAALAQAKTKKQRGLASLYLARLYFTEKQFDTAQTWYNEAFKNDKNLRMTALVEWAAACLLEPGNDLDALIATLKKEFDKHGKEARYMYWYALALTLTPLDAEWATAAFDMAVKLDSAGGAKRDRKRVLATLRWLNARHADALIALVKDAYPWLVSTPRSKK